MHLRHHWTIRRAVRKCRHAWTGEPLGDDVIERVPDARSYHLSFYPSEPAECFVVLYEACTQDGCGARRRREAKQPFPRDPDPWVDLGTLPESLGDEALHEPPLPPRPLPPRYD